MADAGLNAAALAMLDAVRASGTMKPEKVPAEWWSIKQIAAHWKLSEVHTAKIVRRSKLPMQKFTIQAGCRVIPVPHYDIRAR